ncbi:MAG: biotin/lipoyl-binding protein, partial [Desulfobacterales bacterium]
MRFKFGFVVIDRLLHLFLWLMMLFIVMAFAVLWFFDIDVTARGKGVVKCRKWVDIKPQVSGIIREMIVKEGQWVSKEDVLFVLEDRERKLEVDAAALRVAELKIAIAKSESRILSAEERVSGEIDETRASLDAAKAQYRIARKGPKPEELELARTRVGRYEIQAEKAAHDSQQRQRAYSMKLISKQDMEEAIHHERLAEADLRMIRGELNLLRNRYDEDQVAVAKAEVDRCRAIYAKT